MIYFDYAANTPVDERVLEAFCNDIRTYIGNPNSQHEAGFQAKEKMVKYTEAIAKQLGVKPSEVIYTSGASEANNMAIKGIASTYRQKGKHMITTVLEHSSVSGAFTLFQNQGYEVDLVDIKRDGNVDLEHLKELLRQDTILVSIGYVDSELGVVQPMEEIKALIAQYPNCHLHVDATQAVGRIPVEFNGIDLMSFAPHKFFGINGCGVLVKREGLVIEPLIHGGASTTVYRSGTPVVALASSINTALSLAYETMDDTYETVKKYNEELRKRFAGYPLVHVNSTEKSLPYILNVSVKGVKSSIMQAALNERGICVSTKSACSVTNTPSRAVFAVARDRKIASSSIRISLSNQVTMEEIEEFFLQFDACYKELTVCN